ncbi:MAG: glycosyltransferase family 4 protein [Candidatus Magasanikbacteria bacterium]|nr:glycosyltransferase family 4 protein [Candidatus Magasanikbacteria bacterium]
MKICLISNLYPPYARGGAEQVVKNTVEGLLARGHEVVVITARPLVAEKVAENAAGVGGRSARIYRFYPHNIFFYGNDFKYPFWLRFFWHLFDVFNFHSYWRVRRILKKEKPDVVHTHNLKGLGYLIPRAIRGLDLRHVHTLHDVQLVEPSGIIIKGAENQWPYNFFLRRWYEKICRVLFGSPEVVISPSNFLLEFYESRGFFQQSRKVVVPNPVIENNLFQHHAEPTGFFSFLYLGQIEDHKGVLFLIRVFLNWIPTFVGMTKRIALHIVGAGSKLSEAKRLADGCPQIIFHGKVDRAQLPRIFSQTDMAIVPSLCYENSPTVIFESFSFGVPVLASSIEGVAELIKNGENGLTFEAGNEAALIEKMSWCSQHQTEITAMRHAALKSIEGRGLDAYLDKLLNLCYNR